jgi:hypothetical protein
MVLKRYLIAIFICSFLIVTACGKLERVVDFELIANETSIIALHIGGVDENGASTDETNITIEEENKIKKVLALLGDIDFVPIEKKDVLNEGLHKAIGYNLFFIEDYDSQEHPSLWLLSDGETIIIPTWEEQYYIIRDAANIHKQILTVLEVQF